MGWYDWHCTMVNMCLYVQGAVLSSPRPKAEVGPVPHRHCEHCELLAGWCHKHECFCWADGSARLNVLTCELQAGWCCRLKCLWAACQMKLWLECFCLADSAADLTVSSGLIVLWLECFCWADGAVAWMFLLSWWCCGLNVSAGLIVLWLECFCWADCAMAWMFLLSWWCHGLNVSAGLMVPDRKRDGKTT